MNYPIIIKKEITDFLEAQDFNKIYTNLSDSITSPNRVEVWLKSDIFITIKVQVKSDIVTQIVLYHAGNEEVQDFYLHDGKRAFLGTFYADVRSMKEVPVSQFSATSWKQYCKVFVTKESYGKELVNAKNLLAVLKDLKTELRDKFHDVEEMLNTMISGNVNSEVTFKQGDVLKDESQHLYRFLGDKDTVGNYLFLDNDSHSRYMDYNAFKNWKRVNVLTVLEETLERFYMFFDPEFINKILDPVTAELGWSATDSETIHHNCEPFGQWVKQKKTMIVEKDVTGLKFGFETKNSMKVSVFMDFMTSFISFKADSYDFIGRDNEIPEEEFFNPFLWDISSYSRGVSRVLGLLSNIYETFSWEIAELNLTTAFIDIYNMWEQIYSSVEHLDQAVNTELLNKLKSNFEEKPASPKTSNRLKHVDAFNIQKPKTIIKMEDTPLSAVMKMSDGNPGASVALASLMKHPELVKPAEPFFEILALDSLNLYGNELYDFVTICCENSIKNFRLVSLNRSYGNVGRTIIHQLTSKKESFLKCLDNEGLENFKNWSAFEDCYPNEEDVPFDPNREFHTWTELQPKSDKKGEILSGTDFLEKALKQNFVIGWYRYAKKDCEFILFHPDGLILHVYAPNNVLKKAVIYGEVPISEQEKENWGGVGAGEVFMFVKDVSSELEEFLARAKELTLYSAWPVEHKWFYIINPKEEQEFTVDGVIDYKKKELLNSRKLVECCKEIKQIVTGKVIKNHFLKK